VADAFPPSDESLGYCHPSASADWSVFQAALAAADHWSAWYAHDFLAGAAITIALVVFGFYVSLGEQKLFTAPAFNE